MCGIVAYFGKSRKLNEIVINTLKKLEFRGYDSSGLAVINDGDLRYWKALGSVDKLEEKIKGSNIEATISIAHTRWSTHGKVCLPNTHPIVNPKSKIAVVHNGVIDNYHDIKEALLKKGYTFYSETDTEVITNLISFHLDSGKTFKQAVQMTTNRLEGFYSFCVIYEKESKLILVNKGTSLVVGIKDDDYYIASELNAISSLIDKYYFTEEGEVIDLSDELVRQFIDVEDVIDQDPTTMLEEIYEQVKLRIPPDVYNIDTDYKNLKRIRIIACGSSFYAGLIGKYYLEDIAKIPTEVIVASEFDVKFHADQDFTIFISQSGETADVLRCARHITGYKLCVTNNVNSRLVGQCNQYVELGYGQEYGVAATKTFTATIVTLLNIAYTLNGKACPFSIKEPIKSFLDDSDQLETIFNIVYTFNLSKGFLYTSRGINVPIALEGALKMREVAYKHCLGIPSGELKHGSIALIDDTVPVVAIITGDDNRHKIINNCREIISKGGSLIIITDREEQELLEMSEHIVYVPEVDKLLSPIINVIPLQLIAFYTSIKLGFNPDRPRNLAKSVTVE
jgi:glucosamine--fructose-6-phosphate aminotransferase (isomerizing)